MIQGLLSTKEMFGLSQNLKSMMRLSKISLAKPIHHLLARQIKFKLSPIHNELEWLKALTANVRNVMLIQLTLKDHPPKEVAKVSTIEQPMLKMVIRSGGDLAQMIKGLLFGNLVNGLLWELRRIRMILP